MTRKQWVKLGCGLVLVLALFQVPSLALANHGDEEEGEPARTGSGLIFDMSGCTTEP